MNALVVRPLLIGGLLLCTLLLSAQSDTTRAPRPELKLDNPRTYHAVSARVVAFDYETPNSEILDASLTYALELGYRRQLGRYFGIAAPVRVGVIDVGNFENSIVTSLDLLAKVYPLGTEGSVSPYVHAGAGIVSEAFEDANHQTPLGGGLNFALGGNSWANVQAEYRLSSQDNRQNLTFGVGYVYRLSSVDLDGDGIVNRNDACPDQAGPAATQGCPDADGDTIADDADACPDLAGLPSLNGCPDRDNDGIADGEDKCPQLAGPAASQGCPDIDGDEVPDPEDECPTDAGPAALNGCPDSDGDGIANPYDKCPSAPGDRMHDGCPDSDGDGVFDDRDRCPTQAADTPDGCPVKDSDGDGFPDTTDDCPTEAGPLGGCPDADGDGIANKNDDCPAIPGPTSNGGCPEAPPPVTEAVRERLDYAAQAVAFETGSAQLKDDSYVILAEIAGILRQYPDYNLRIAGHTDNTGSDVANLKLSERRANSCRDFLVRTGISPRRITAIGFGESRPKVSNATAAGRRENRRTEFELSR